MESARSGSGGSNPLIKSRYHARLVGEDVPTIYESALINSRGERVEVEVNAGLCNYNGRLQRLPQQADPKQGIGRHRSPVDRSR